MTRKIVLVLLAACLALAVFILHRPADGSIYRGLQKTTILSDRSALIRELDGCVVMSFDQRDIANAIVPISARNHVFLIAVDSNIETGKDAGGIWLRDRSSGLKAHVGSAIEGEIVVRPSENYLTDLARVGWLANRNCGTPFAELRSIRNVQ